MRTRITTFIEKQSTKNFILGVILFNAILLGLETSQPIMAQFGQIIHILDQICLIIFVAEILAKLFAYRFGFFKDGWNVFDFLVVGIALIPAGQSMAALRVLRVMRVFRLMSAAPRLRRVVEGFLSALPSMGSVFLLMAIIFYIGSVIATKLFSSDFPQWFGTMGRSAYSLFQIMTLESWSMGIVRPVMEVYPYAWAFFVPFILATSFAVVNLLVGLIVNSMQDAHSEEANEETDHYRDEVLERLRNLEQLLEKNKK
ncbi:MAG: ion transporter [Pseudomonadota bacterium]